MAFTTEMDIGRDVFIAHGGWIDGYSGLALGDEVSIGPYTVIVTTNHTLVGSSYRFGVATNDPIVVGSGTWVGAHATLCGGVTIGSGALVAAGAVVVCDVLPGAKVGGVPARPLGSSQ